MSSGSSSSGWGAEGEGGDVSCHMSPSGHRSQNSTGEAAASSRTGTHYCIRAPGNWHLGTSPRYSSTRCTELINTGTVLRFKSLVTVPSRSALPSIAPTNSALATEPLSDAFLKRDLISSSCSTKFAHRSPYFLPEWRQLQDSFSCF